MKLTGELTTDLTYAIYGSQTEFGPARGPRQLSPKTLKPKYEGRAIYELLKGAGVNVFPVAADLDSLGGDKVYASLDAVPEKVDALILCLAKQHGPRAIGEAVAAGVKRVWFQPATDSPEARALCSAKGIEAVSGCALRHRTVSGITRFISPCFYMGLKATKLPVT